MGLYTFRDSFLWLNPEGTYGDRGPKDPLFGAECCRIGFLALMPFSGSEYQLCHFLSPYEPQFHGLQYGSKKGTSFIAML